MRHWSQLGTRNWRAKPGRTILSALAITLGVAVVVWVTGCYESVQRTITRVVLDWIGRTHISIESVGGRWSVFSDDIVPELAALPDVKDVTTRTMEWIDGAPQAAASTQPARDFTRLEITGLDPQRESHFRTHVLASGRMMTGGESGVVVAEKSLAESWRFGVGDTLLLKSHEKPLPVRAFRVIGLIDRRRATAAQLPMLWASISDVQQLCGLPHRVKGVDVILHDASPTAMAAALERVRAITEQHQAKTNESLKVATTEAQLQKLAAAQGLLQFILLLSAVVLLLTAFFIITATMNMGLVERIGQIGLLRCVGTSRAQIGVVVLLESLPAGLVGIALGIPAGYLLQILTKSIVPEYVGDMALSRSGVWMAVIGGLATALLGAAVPALRALSVSPVEASRPLAHPVRKIWLALAALLGLALLGAHEMLLRSIDAGAARFDTAAIAAIVLMYAGYALIVPSVVAALASISARFAAGLLGLRRQLLGDEIARAPWRSAAVCSGLMVGLSLIVGLAVWGESVRAGWQFPKEMPEGLLYQWEGAKLTDARKLESLTTIKDLVIADHFSFSLRKPGLFSMGLLDKFTKFVATDPERIPHIISLTYLEGSQRDALPKLKGGGYVLVSREFAEANEKHLGDTFTVYSDGKQADFRIAGVVASPAVDIAVNFFNASEYFQIYAVGAVIGTFDDAAKYFGRHKARMFLFNFNLPTDADSTRAATLPAHDHPKKNRGSSQHPWFDLSTDADVTSPAEQAVVDEMMVMLGEDKSYAFATAAQLKRQIDSNLRNVTLLLSAVPILGLIVSALGVGNLMMASVASRRREIAVLRAVGMTQGQILRMIVGEALILGLLGSAVGLALGLHLGHASNTLTELLSGFRPDFAIPWRLLGLAGGLATALCIIAGLVPARLAARSNIVAALQSG